ncbi:MAG: hypothetical protein ACPHCJ_11675, partial [Oceanococcaceae bacterium]
MRLVTRDDDSGRVPKWRHRFEHETLLQAKGEPVALLVQGRLRRLLARLLRGGVPGLQVLAYDEIPDNQRLRVVSTL